MSKFLFSIFFISTLVGCHKISTQAPEKPKITVAYTTQPQSALIHIAIAKGYFADEGLEVQSSIHSFGKASLQTLLDNKSDFATVAETPVMFSVIKGEKIFVIANVEATTMNNAIVARKDAGINKASDLKGKRVGFTPGTTSEFFLDSMLAANIFTRKDIQAIPLKPDEMQEGITSRKVDAVCTWNFPLTQIYHLLGANGTIIFDREIYTETYNVAAQQDFVQKNPATVKAFLRALLKAESYLEKNPVEARGIMAKAANIDISLVQEIWSHFNFHVGLDQTLLITLEDETRWAIKNKLTDKTEMPDYRQYIHAESLKAIKPEAVKLNR